MGDETLKRRLITFMGGIDLCDGRYDTPRHSLFHTLATVHTEDFHQACIAGADISKGGGLLYLPLHSECQKGIQICLRELPSVTSSWWHHGLGAWKETS